MASVLYSCFVDRTRGWEMVNYGVVSGNIHPQLFVCPEATFMHGSTNLSNGTCKGILSLPQRSCWRGQVPARAQLVLFHNVLSWWQVERPFSWQLAIVVHVVMRCGLIMLLVMLM